MKEVQFHRTRQLNLQSERQIIFKDKRERNMMWNDVPSNI